MHYDMVIFGSIKNYRAIHVRSSRILNYSGENCFLVKTRVFSYERHIHNVLFEFNNSNEIMERNKKIESSSNKIIIFSFFKKSTPLRSR